MPCSGCPISGQIRYLTGTRGFRRTELGFYAQDVYKATQKLTLTLGLRYENFIGWPWTEVADRMYQFVPEKQDVVRVGTEGIPRSGVRPDNNNLSPRVGLAYRFLPKTVFRAAYGMYYSAPQWDITRNLAANPPEFVVSSFANDQFDIVNARTAAAGLQPARARLRAGHAASHRHRCAYAIHAAVECRDAAGTSFVAVADRGLCGNKRNETPGIYKHQSAGTRYRRTRGPPPVPAI